MIVSVGLSSAVGCGDDNSPVTPAEVEPSDSEAPKPGEEPKGSEDGV